MIFKNDYCNVQINPPPEEELLILPSDRILPSSTSIMFPCRYPKEAAALFTSTLQKNRAMHRKIGVASGTEETQPPSEQVLDVTAVKEALGVAGKEVKEAQELIVGVEERASQLLGAANILARTEGALGLL